MIRRDSSIGRNGSGDPATRDFTRGLNGCDLIYSDDGKIDRAGSGFHCVANRILLIRNGERQSQNLRETDGEVGVARSREIKKPVFHQRRGFHGAAAKWAKTETY